MDRSASPSTPGVRLSVLIAREARVGVVFRRGPTHRVRLVRWCLKTDTFIPGQWFKGRIYEQRCDLSPDGEQLLYFAASYRRPLYSWTAVSRPPYLTALALWPKGDGWGGGGLFESPRTILLNHPSDQAALGDGFALPPWMRVRPFGAHPGHGEDGPVMEARWRREGWRQVQEGRGIDHGLGKPLWIAFDPPEIWEKPCPTGNRWRLHKLLRGLHARGGPWYVFEHVIERPAPDAATVSLGLTDWADWDTNGDLLFARDGRLCRLRVRGAATPSLSRARQLVDLADQTFSPQPPPPAAREWLAPLRLAAPGGQRHLETSRIAADGADCGE